MNRIFKNIAIKGVAVAAVVALSAGVFCGCGKDTKKKEEATEKPAATDSAGESSIEKSYFEYDLSYMSLGQYKEVKITKDLTVSDNEIAQAYYDDLKSISSFNTKHESGKTVEADIYKKLTAMYEKSRAIKKNDLIYFDYAGYLGDEAFEGGTAKNQELLIGSGNFIPGFEDAVIGHTPGNEFSIDVTFPKDYHAADLAGKAVVFKITVHHIYPEISEESVALLGEAYKLKFEKEAAQSSEEKVYKPSFTDKSSYEKYVVSVLKAKKEQSFNESKRNLVLNAIVENTKFTSYPQDIIDDYDEIVEKQAEQYGIEKDVFLSYFYGIGTEEQYTEFLQKQVSSECVIIGIIQTEKFTVTEDEITKSAEEIAKQYGFTTVEELYKQVPKVSVENNLLSNKALDFITENAVITTIDETSKS